MKKKRYSIFKYRRVRRDEFWKINVPVCFIDHPPKRAKMKRKRALCALGVISPIEIGTDWCISDGYCTYLLVKDGSIPLEKVKIYQKRK